MKYLTRKSPDSNHFDHDLCAALCYRIQSYIKQNTDIAVVGLSGGADSTLVACLCARELGADNVYGISMPYCTTDYQKFNKRSASLADRLGIHHYIRDISKTVDAFKDEFGEMTDLNQGNLRSRTRMMFLYSTACDISESHKCKRVRVIGTGNLSEDYIGYDTKGGDALADFFPIGDLYKQEVYDLLDFMWSMRVIEDEHIDRTPSAGLWEGQTDEGELGYTYNEMAPAIELLRVNGHSIPAHLIDVVSPAVVFVRDRHIANQHKHMAPPVCCLRDVYLQYATLTGLSATHTMVAHQHMHATQ